MTYSYYTPRGPGYFGPHAEECARRYEALGITTGAGPGNGVSTYDGVTYFVIAKNFFEPRPGVYVRWDL